MAVKTAFDTQPLTSITAALAVFTTVGRAGLQPLALALTLTLDP